MSKYKFAEVHMPRRAKELAYLIKRVLFIFRHRDHEWSVNRGREACDTRTNHCGLGLMTVGEVVGQGRHRVPGPDPLPTSPPLR